MLETNTLFRKLAIGNHKLRELSDEDVKAVQHILLDMLTDLDELCRKNGLSYFICGGTALGAVRHKGFIPWDEDIDISLPRKDYDKLAKLVKEQYADKYWVQNINDTRKYDLNFMKIRKKGTTYVEMFETEEDKAGVFIDIFPIENSYDNPLRRRIHGLWVEFLLLCASCVRISKKEKMLEEYFDQRKVKKVVKFKSFIGKCLSFYSVQKWCRIVENAASSCKKENTKYITIPSGRKHYFGEMYTRTSFFPPKEIEFEGRRFYTMSNPDEYLTKLFGDYMRVPKEEERERHSIVKLDLEK